MLNLSLFSDLVKYIYFARRLFTLFVINELMVTMRMMERFVSRFFLPQML